MSSPPSRSLLPVRVRKTSSSVGLSARIDRTPPAAWAAAMIRSRFFGSGIGDDVQHRPLRGSPA